MRRCGLAARAAKDGFIGAIGFKAGTFEGQLRSQYQLIFAEHFKVLMDLNRKFNAPFAAVTAVGRRKCRSVCSL